MRIFEKLQPLSLLALRLALGVIFFYHGYEILTGHSADALAAFAGLGLPSYAFDTVGTLELFGAMLLVMGLLTRFTALLLTPGCSREMGLGAGQSGPAARRNIRRAQLRIAAGALRRPELIFAAWPPPGAGLLSLGRNRTTFLPEKNAVRK